MLLLTHSLTLRRYARHFMSACKRILGLSYHPILRGQLGIEYGGRRVAVTCSHMAIDAERIEATLLQDAVREKVVALRQKFVGKKIFAGCDTVERLKGIPCKLLAFDAVRLALSSAARSRLCTDVRLSLVSLVPRTVSGLHWEDRARAERHPSSRPRDRLPPEQERDRDDRRVHQRQVR